MPTFDGGHCFLTALVPIATDDVVMEGGIMSSRVHMVREALSTIPTAIQSPRSLKNKNSPFARNDKTHFVRFAVIDDAIYNGRMTNNTIAGALFSQFPSASIKAKYNPSIPQPVDQLNCPYLMFVVDFDAPKGVESELDDYLREIWKQAGEDLLNVFKNCRGFTATLTDAEGFKNYVKRCQIETTMPFNDYWVGPPPLKSPSNSVMGGIVLALAAALWFVVHRLFGNPGLLGSIALGILGIVIVGLCLYWLVMWRGPKPFPMAPNSDLRSVLKALYLQQQFTALAIKAQGLDDQQIHAAFGDFLATHKPGDLSSPTNERGVIKLGGQL